MIFGACSIILSPSMFTNKVALEQKIRFLLLHYEEYITKISDFVYCGDYVFFSSINLILLRKMEILKKAPEVRRGRLKEIFHRNLKSKVIFVL